MMRLDEYVQQLPFSALIQMAKAHEGELLVEPKESLFERVTQHLLSPLQVEGCFARMTRPEALLLRFFLLRAPATHVSLQEIKQASILTSEEIRLALSLLRNKGLIYAARRFWGEEVYAMPTDVYPVWLGHLVSRHLRHDPVAQVEEQEVELVSSHPPIYLDILHFLAFLCKHEVMLTQKGTIFKRTAQRLSENLYTLQQDASFLAEAVPHTGGEGDPALLLIWDMGERLGLIRRTSSRLEIDAQRLNRWIEWGPSALSRQVYAIWKRVGMAGRRPLFPLLSMMEVLSPHGWHTWSGVTSRWEQLRGEPLSPAILASAQPLLLHWLHLWGYVDLAIWREELVWRWGEFSPWLDALPSEEKFLVQPDFELLASPYLSTTAHWNLALITDVKRRDRINVYRLSRESFLQALEMGMDWQAIRQFLSEGSATGLPPNVSDTLARWGEGYGRVSLMDAMVLECSDPSLADELAAQADLSLFVVTRLSSCHFVVYRSRVKELLKWLEQKGYEPRKRIRNLGVEESEPAEYEEEFAGLDEAMPWPLRPGLWPVDGEQTNFLLNKTLPALLSGREDAHAAERLTGDFHIPPAWRRELRRYHLSTMKEMLRICTVLRKRVRIEWGEEGAVPSLVEFIPMELQEEGAAVVSGFPSEAEDACAIPLHHIRRIQVLS